MEQAEKYLYDLMYYIHCTHLDMGGKNTYALSASGFKLIDEIKAWMASQQPVEADSSKPSHRNCTEIYQNNDGSFTYK